MSNDNQDQMYKCSRHDQGTATGNNHDVKQNNINIQLSLDSENGHILEQVLSDMAWHG